MSVFVCQISEIDWLVSREIGVYGNREGSEKNGKPRFFKEMKKGDEIIQSIIEDLIGMKKGDIVFFHVIKRREGESSVHGIYRVREEPFYNDSERLWSSSKNFVYPYRFCFEPHPEHQDLCKFDANISVGEFYKSIENREIRSIFTLEREVRGAGHAVKIISRDDAQQIIKLLYRDFHSRSNKDPINFKSKHISGPSLRNSIFRIGEIEFAIKALIAFKLGQKDKDLLKYLPACRNEDYDFLIESFIGQTARKPSDLLCVSSGTSQKVITILEAKTDYIKISDIIQPLKYQELFKLRNIDKSSLDYKTSICLLGKDFQKELINYVKIRNEVLYWEEIILLKYLPTEDGKNAAFSKELFHGVEIRTIQQSYRKINIDKFQSLISSDPNNLYVILERKISPKIKIGLEYSQADIHLLQKNYNYIGQNFPLGKILVREIQGKCTLSKLSDFMKLIYNEANKLEGNFMAVEPVILAEDYDASSKFFIEEYNTYETYAGRQPISALILSEC